MIELSRKKTKKPRRPSEPLDLPKRYIVNGINGVYEAAEHELATRRFAEPTRLMGTHESLEHARERLGW